jgi:AraC-like DNA-binding protein
VRPLADISLAAGFCDQSHLTKAFRRIAGTTPGRFRRNC